MHKIERTSATRTQDAQPHGLMDEVIERDKSRSNTIQGNTTLSLEKFSFAYPDQTPTVESFLFAPILRLPLPPLHRLLTLTWLVGSFPDRYFSLNEPMNHRRRNVSGPSASLPSRHD